MNFDQNVERLNRTIISDYQLQQFQAMLGEVLPTNKYYQKKLQGKEQISSWGDFAHIPFTTKSEIALDQLEHPPFGTNLTYPEHVYTRFHQTSGTTGKEPIKWLDTAESWDWWQRMWGHVYNAAGVTSKDRVFYPFSFGPFIGFWSGYEAVSQTGAMMIPGGGMSTQQRLNMITKMEATVVCCTPTYALRMAEVAKNIGLDLPNSTVKKTVHAGEPGASIPAVKKQIENGWGAKSFDHTGLTELGATGFSCGYNEDVHLSEDGFIFEVIDPETKQLLPSGTQGELVATNLGRFGMPLIRYRTGDTVILDTDPCICGRTFARMKGGILGRSDDMFVVRGVNVFPSAIEGIVRQFPEVSEFNIRVQKIDQMDQLNLVIESSVNGDSNLAKKIAKAVEEQLLLKVDSTMVPIGTLEKSELKSKRVIRE